MAAPTFFGSASSPADNGSQADAATLTITPPGSMTNGQLVVVICAAAVSPYSSEPTVAVTGGQTWNDLGALTGANDTDAHVFWCQFNGTWAANPQFTFASESGTQPVSAVMLVFTPDAVGTWTNTVATAASQASADPMTVTDFSPGSYRDVVSIGAILLSGTAVTSTSVSGTGWTRAGTQFRNTAGTDLTLVAAYRLQATPATTANISFDNSAALAGMSVKLAFANFLTPTISPNTADATNFGSDTTPTLEFTGTDGNADDVRYTVQIDSVSTFDSQTGSLSVVDSYSESNADGNHNIGTSATSIIAAGQSFDAGSGGTLHRASFYVRKVGSPTGSLYARLYAHTGTYGSGGTGTGGILATSDEFTVSTLTTSSALITLQFTGAERYTLAGGNTKYVMILYWSGSLGDGTNYVQVGYDLSSSTHGGNVVSQFPDGTWNLPGGDTIFYVEKDGPTPFLSKVSGTDSGFANTVTGGDTDPFNSSEKASFTVQAGDALTDGTWYWRARCKDPSGSNVYSSWTTTRSFTISSGPGAYPFTSPARFYQPFLVR